jgi:hypothetical protein
MLDAVYVDAKETKSIVAIKPKPPFKPVFQVAASCEKSDISILNEPLKDSSVFLVETGEGLLLSICNQHLLSALLVIPRGDTAAVNVWAGQAHKLAKYWIIAWFESITVGGTGQ